MDTRLIARTALLGIALLALSCRPETRTPVSGTIETDEVHIGSRYGGRVTQLFAREGESLKAGQPVVELDAAELPARREQTAALLAEQVAGPRREELDAAKSDWEALTADLQQARADARRAQELFSRNTISVDERDRAVTRAAALEKNAASAHSRYELLVAGTRPEQITRTRAQLAEIDSHLAELKISAPSDSVLEVLNVKVGDVVAPNQPLATLLLTQHLWIRVYIPQTWLGSVQPGGSAQVRVDAYPGKMFTGTIEQIARQAEFTPRNVQTAGERVQQVYGIKLRLENSSGDLRAGMTAEVTFPSAAH
ncbi:MAG: efflux RND transporter periplasmic adaptor subunit [Verrucomicrobiota bacterium]